MWVLHPGLPEASRTRPLQPSAQHGGGWSCDHPPWEEGCVVAHELPPSLWGEASREGQACVPDGGRCEHLALGAHTEDNHGGHHHDEVCGGGVAHVTHGSHGAGATAHSWGRGWGPTTGPRSNWVGSSSARAGEAPSTHGNPGPSQSPQGPERTEPGPQASTVTVPLPSRAEEGPRRLRKANS